MKTLTVQAPAFSPVPGVSARGLARFLLAQCEPVDGCLVWRGQVSNGHAIVTYDNRPMRAQRVAWALAEGKHPGRRRIGSCCGRGDCLRPDHLRNISPVSVADA